jgi:hypothetical protein
MKNLEKEIRAVAAMLRDKQNGVLPDVVTVEITPEFLEKIADELASIKKRLSKENYRSVFDWDKNKNPHTSSGDALWKHVQHKAADNQPDF